MREWTPLGLREALNKGRPLRLVDVREPEEFAICRLPGAELIPLATLPDRLKDLRESDRPIVLYCHHGVRSEMALVFLERNGVTNAGHLLGGIDAWADQVDPSILRY